MSFDFFDEPQKKEAGLEEMMNKIDDHSLEFDQFDPVDNNQPNDKSFNSDFFGTDPKPEEKGISQKSRGKDESFDFQNSRNLSQISYQGGRSFRYDNPPAPQTAALSSNSRYDKLQEMLSKAKKNNLDMIYKYIDQQNAYKVEDKFNDKQEFNEYRRKFKEFKRNKEEDFTGRHGNYNFRDNRYDFPQKTQSQLDNPFFDEQVEKNFKKKQSNKYKGNNLRPQAPFEKKPSVPQQPPAKNVLNFLPDEFEQEDEGDFFIEMNEEQVNNEVKKYKQKKQQEEAQLFFSSEENQKKQKTKKAPLKLSEIREERPNLFQMTHEEEKMAKLIANYQEMKSNFNDLMYNLKSTNTDQEKIIRELKNLKESYENKEEKMKKEAQNKQQQRKIKEKEKEEKEKKFAEIRQQIGKVKEGADKDLLYMKINEKIENLEIIVKNAITAMNQEKQQKFVPKIINYYRDQQPRSSRSKGQSNLGLSRQDIAAEHQRSQQRSRIQNLIEEQLAPIQEAIRDLKEQKREEQALYNLQEFCSPLQLDLSTQEFPMNLSRNRSELQAPFKAPEGANQFFPTTLDQSNKYLRRCLTQKSSIIFESFQFYIVGKFTITGNDRYPVTCEVRVSNKCAVSLYDIFVVVFGPQAQQGQLQMRPAKLMYDQFKTNSFFLFEIDLTKLCLESGGFSIMLSYKTDMINKKKIVFKVVLPFVQLIKPEFIYQQQFVSGWNHMGNEWYIAPKALDFKTIRSHEDLKLILPLTELCQSDPNAFSYGIMFHYPTSDVVFMMKITCYISGKASIHLKSSSNSPGDKRLRQEILNIMNFLCYG